MPHCMARVCRDKLQSENEIRNELFSRRLIDDIKFKSCVPRGPFIAYVTLQVREISLRVTVHKHQEKISWRLLKRLIHKVKARSRSLL